MYKEDAANIWRHPLIVLFRSILIHLKRDSKEVFMLVGGLDRKKFITRYPLICNEAIVCAVGMPA